MEAHVLPSQSASPEPCGASPGGCGWWAGGWGGWGEMRMAARPTLGGSIAETLLTLHSQPVVSAASAA